MSREPSSPSNRARHLGLPSDATKQQAKPKQKPPPILVFKGGNKSADQPSPASQPSRPPWARGLDMLDADDIAAIEAIGADLSLERSAQEMQRMERVRQARMKARRTKR